MHVCMSMVVMKHGCDWTDIVRKLSVLDGTSMEENPTDPIVTLADEVTEDRLRVPIGVEC